MSYCTYCKNLPADDVNVIYHDHHYGFPISSDNESFGRLILEINQAGLSWQTILKKQENFRAAFDNFDIETISNYKDEKVEQLLQDSGIIRNRLKIQAVIYNANVFKEIISSHGNFVNWLNLYKAYDLTQWVKLFKQHFKFVGGEIVKEFLMSVGYLEGAHEASCPVYEKIIKMNPVWLNK